MSWLRFGKKSLATSVQVTNLIRQLKGIEGEVLSQVDKGEATQAIQSFVNSAKKVSAQSRVCLYVTHACLQNSEEIQPLLTKFESLNSQVKKKEMDSISYINTQSAIWNNLTDDFRKFDLHTRRFSPQDFLAKYGNTDIEVSKLFASDFAAQMTKNSTGVVQEVRFHKTTDELVSGSAKNQLMNTQGQTINAILNDEKKLEDWFTLLSIELKRLSGLHDDMNKSALTLGGLSGRMGRLAKSATSTAASAVESAKGIEDYAKQVLALQTNMQGTVNTLHDTGQVKFDAASNTLIKSEVTSINQETLNRMGSNP